MNINYDQIAFLPEVNGCIEHSHCLREIISHARQNKQTVHVTFFDLADAFGSVSHELLIHTLQRKFMYTIYIVVSLDMYKGQIGNLIYSSSRKVLFKEITIHLYFSH